MHEETAERRAPREPSSLVLGAAYVTNFGALATSTPFLAVYLEHRGFDTALSAELLALLPLVRVVATPGWTMLADELRSIAGVLRVVSVGAALAFATLYLESPSRALVAAALLAFAAFRAPFGALIDTLVLRWAARENRAFGRLRAFGTGGYMLGALATGELVARVGPRAVVHVSIVVLVLAALVSFALPRGGVAPRAPRLAGNLARLVRRPRFVLLLVAAALHQVGLAPYDALFPAYLTDLAGASYAGAAVALGAAAELVFLATSGPLIRRLGPARILALAFAASIVRWSVMALVTAPLVLVGIQVLHAFGFGAFYVASVAIVDEESPDETRASAQGIYGAFAYGIAASASLSLAGVVAHYSNLRVVLGVGVFASALALAVALLLARHTPPVRV